MGSEIESAILRTAEARRTRVVLALLRTLAIATIFVVAASFLDPSNDWRVTAAVHGTDLFVMGIAWWLVARGKAVIASWLMSFMFWTIVAASAWLFGGLQYELAAAYFVSVMVAGTTLGGRAAMFFAGLSIAMSTLVLSAHLGGWLPEPISPLSVINAWISITTSMLLGSYLLHVALSSLEEAVRNVTEAARARDEAQQRLIQAQKMEPVGRLAAGVAHDFNNLLSAITTIAGVLRRRVGEQPRVAPLLDDLEGATDRAAMMTRQLLAFSRARAPSFEVFELDSMVRRSVRIFSRLLGDDVKVDLVLDAEKARIRADRGQIEQILLNLAVNARDAMPNGGTLRIATSTSQDGGRVALEVSDTGVGIPAESLSRLFEPFFTTKSSGTGLGLSTVRDIVDATRGSIRVASTIGAGTTFIVDFPRHDQEIEEDVVDDDSLIGTMPSGLRVLLVEDHELVRRSTRQVLEDAGFDVTAVNDGSEALVLLEGVSEFDAVVTDLRMPRLSGEGLADALVARSVSVPIVFTSGHEDRMTELLEALPMPKRFLAKPLSADALIQAVHAVISEHRTSRASAASRSA